MRKRPPFGFLHTQKTEARLLMDPYLKGIALSWSCEREMLNWRQRIVLWAGGIAAGLMLLFPPFFDTGGLYGGVQFAFVLRPPAPDFAIDFRPAIAVETLLLQLGTVACFALAAAVACDSRANRASTSVFRTGAFLALIVGIS